MASALVKHDEHLKLSPLRKLAQWLSDYSHLYNRLRGLVGLRRATRQPGVWAERKNKVEDDLGPAAELTFALVRRMNELSRQAGARFYVVVHPDEFAFRHRSRLLRKLCTAPMLEGITVVEMGDRHRAAGLDFCPVRARRAGPPDRARARGRGGRDGDPGRRDASAGLGLPRVCAPRFDAAR